ncbi:Putative colanic acid biosynthesis glycosyltransferase WcaL protein [Halorhabdus tiamatea SARL4B]|nr:glycosyltransferase [Halorhabdus tiamatea]ERJ06988.1 Putative colanic acid biosynthesis glycosyltransferase WcaL protein [Halorhabdus tiamatea SARL4B]
MKIAFVVGNFPKNSETFVLNQITGLLNRGHEVDIFARYKPSEERIHEEVSEYGLKQRTTYSNIPDNILLRLLFSPVQALRAPASRLRPMFESLKVHTYGRDALSLQAFYMTSSFNPSNYEITYAHFGPNGNIGSIFIRSGFNTNLVTMFHGNDIRMALNRNKQMYEPAFKESNLLLTNSEFNRKNLIQLGADPDKIDIQPIAIDTDRFHCPSERDQTNTGKIKITTIGRLVEEKGHEFAINAVSRINSRTNKNIEYHIVGSGPLKADLQRQTRRLNVEKSVVFCGQRSRSEVIRKLCHSDIFLLPSIDEGFGTVLLEAQSTKIPIVASRTGGIPEAVSTDSSVLIEPQNSRVIADEIVELIQNPSRRKAMGEAGRKFVINNYTIDVANDLLQSRFKRILHEDTS